VGGRASSLVSENRATIDFRVRLMNLADLPQVVEIERAWASSPWSWATFENELKVPFSRAIVAYRIASPAIVSGYLVRWRVADEMHLLDLAVAERERGRGLGRLLLDSLLEEARDARVRLVTLEVEDTNTIARALYASAGFSETRRRPGYYGTGRDAVVMEWMTPCRDVS
jgi:ribosomal-protein-alanine N-acetyltransferase